MNFATSYGLNKWWSIIISFSYQFHSFSPNPPFTLSFPGFALICFTSFHFYSFWARLLIPCTNGVNEAVSMIRNKWSVWEAKREPGRRERTRPCKLKPHPLLQMLGGNYQPIPELLPTRPFSLPLPLLSRTFQQVWKRNDIPGNGTEEKQRGKTSARERKRFSCSQFECFP